MRLLLSVVLIRLVVVSAEAVGSRRIYTPRRSERGSFGDLFEFVYDSSASHDSSETSETNANDARQFFPFTGLDIGSLSGQANQGVKGLFNIPLVGQFIKPLQQGTEDSGAKVDETNQRSLIGFSNGLDPWWMGPNVCTRKEERTERGKIEKLNATEVGGDSKENRWRLRNVINRKMASCVDLGEVYKCTEKVTHADETKTETTIHECCQGFERADLSGCTKEMELHDLKTTLENLNLTRFLEVTDRNGLNDLITEGNNCTYFVPNNAAWDSVIESELPKADFFGTNTTENSTDSFNATKQINLTRNVIKAHILPGWQYSYDWFNEMVINITEPSSTIRINFYNGEKQFWTANCAQITSTNHKAINGIVHQVDRVLTTATGTLWELLSESQQFSKFLSLIDDELRQRLMNSDEHLTVLAFTDDEFNRLPATVLQAIVGRSKCLKDLISEHIFPNTLCSVAVNGSVKIQNIAGHFISASLSANDDERSSHLKFEGVNVTEADRIATNGVLHVIDGVILLEHMLDTLEALRQRHATNFARLLVENDLDIQNCSEVTVFVPPERSLQTLKAEDIKKTLETHIFTELIELKPRQNLEENDSIAISQSGDIFKLSIGSDVLQFPFTDFLDTINAHIGCSQIVASNVRTCNGIVHFIDKPLTSANLTVFELLKSRSDISQFVNMLKLSSLKNKIDEEDFRGTILAPSNDAIGAVFSGDQKQTLLGDSKKLDLFVKRHIISEVLCEHQLNSAAGPLALSRHRSLAGEVIQGRHSGEKFQIGQSPVSESELRATNGIVYILDRPIMRRLSSLWDIFDFAPDIHSVSDLFDI